MSELVSRALVTLTRWSPNVFQIAGLAVFAAGCFVLATWLGLMAAGCLLALIGWAVDG